MELLIKRLFAIISSLPNTSTSLFGELPGRLSETCLLSQVRAERLAYKDQHGEEPQPLHPPVSDTEMTVILPHRAAGVRHDIQDPFFHKLQLRALTSQCHNPRALEGLGQCPGRALHQQPVPQLSAALRCCTAHVGTTPPSFQQCSPKQQNIPARLKPKIIICKQLVRF